MTPFSIGLSGAVGGLAAAFAAQIVVTACVKAGLGWATLQGPFGPPFFPTAVFLGVFYSVIGGAVSRSSKLAATVLAGVFLSIVLPMAVLERTARMHWGEPVGAPSFFSLERPWLQVSIACLTIPVWTAIGAIGWHLGGRWVGMCAAFAASIGAYLLEGLIQSLAPGLMQGPWRPTGFLPQATVLLDGLLTGAFLGLSVAIARRHYEKIRVA